ncbi:hypothetical protein SEVIR_3G024600v4 [Setaria viridis]|uniref:Uncharacterized protein n=2 Tax=Setaria TaxID=4554 RepID=K3ZB70_SETIT|nr:uncharacterized protein LOC101763478 [Setaria italica]XP_034585081.1 uncharacterized protein LOC117847889 [Setaria viridis]RCV14998.1 hypothetical protein SETIT_3G023900v2 [Setaria italica]TKW24013.1 hypothetical protein SEVIR_3G024600v2 [Setaria viridis]
MRARRWSRAAVVACLVLLAAACAAEARAVPGAEGAGGKAAAAPDGGRRSAFDVVVVGLVSIGLGRRWRAGGDELVDEDKRRVPTGPNPLHNR